MDGMKDLCTEKHRALDDKIARHEKWIGEHETKIDHLERSDAANTTQIDNLTKAIGSQTKAIWGLVSSIVVMLAGFLLWYIQSLPH
jgi:hypothetical protein